MQGNKIHLLSTSPLGNELIKKAAQNNIIVDEVPFIKIEEIVSDEMEKRIQNLSIQKIVVVFTSKNAVDIVGKYISTKTSWEIFCISNSTERRVEKVFGPEQISASASYGNQLAEKILDDNSIKKVIFFVVT